MSCTEIVLSGHKCREKETLTPVSHKSGYCYYHGKIYDGLCNSADTIMLLAEDED